MSAIDRQERLRGLMIGTAVGDAVGLPAEGISRARLRKLVKGRWRHRFFLGRGMISDDTEHTIFVAQCLLAHPDAAERFGRRLAWCLRWWILALPAGIGLATLKASVRLWVGFSPSKSGVDSAGNGPAMRAAPIGAFFATAPGRREEYLKACTRLTHTDSRALVGARVVAELTAWVIRENVSERPPAEELSSVLAAAIGDEESWRPLLEAIREACGQNLSVEEFASSLDLTKGVTGYVNHTVPVAVYAWYAHYGDFEKTLSAVFDCGGDTDTVGAIAGALAGCVVGEKASPEDWVSGIVDWPRGVFLLRALADALEKRIDGTERGDVVRYFWPGVLPRNAFFLVIVLLHGFRRLAPPY